MTPPPPIHLKNSNKYLKIIMREIAFGVKSLKSELFQNWKTEKNFKYVANICMYRGIRYIGLVILASTV